MKGKNTSSGMAQCANINYTFKSSKYAQSSNHLKITATNNASESAALIQQEPAIYYRQANSQQL